MKLVFVRHAETAANAEGRMQGHGDFELSDLGVAQAERLRDRLEEDGFRPTHLYSSPLKRTAATAQIISRYWDTPATYWDDLREHDIGILTGLTWDEAAHKYPDLDVDAVISAQLSGVQGAETLPERRARGGRVVDRLLKSHDNEDVVVAVTHGGILQSILAELLGTDKTWGTSIHNTALFEFSVDLGRWSADGDDRLNTAHWRIDRYNDASHLDS